MTWSKPAQNFRFESKAASQGSAADALITNEEIAALRARAKIITPEVVVELIARGTSIKVEPMYLASGYRISMTIDQRDSRVAEHISISKEDGGDPADMELIARAVLGEYIIRGPVFNKTVTHFIKIVN